MKKYYTNNMSVLIWQENMLWYLSADILCSNNRGKSRAIFNAKRRLLCLLSFKYFSQHAGSFENWGISLEYSRIFGAASSATWVVLTNRERAKIFVGYYKKDQRIMINVFSKEQNNWKRRGSPFIYVRFVRKTWKRSIRFPAKIAKQILFRLLSNRNFGSFV